MRQNININTNGSDTYSGKIPTSGKISFSAVKNEAGRIIKFVEDNTDFKKRLMPDIASRSIFKIRSQAQLSKHIYVYGTSGSQEQTNLLKQAATKAADWGYGIWVNWEVKSDIEVTEKDIRENNLILFGCPESNGIIARINNKLPIRIEKGAIVKGSDKFPGTDKAYRLINPNPENENKFVEIYGVRTKTGLENLQNLSGTNPDYIILNEFGNRLSAGLFDKNWEF